MDLPSGITGFRDHRSETLPTTDARGFRGHCYQAGLLLGGRVIDNEVAERGQIPGNFIAATIALPLETVSVVLNAYHPLIAFCHFRILNEGPLRFRDHSALADLFKRIGGYQVLNFSGLEAPVTPRHLRGLSGAELKQVAYWKPQRVGDVVFNLWD